MDKEGDLRSRTSTRCALRYGGKQTAEIERKEKQISIIVAYLTTTPDFFSKRTSKNPPFTLFHAVIRPFSVIPAEDANSRFIFRIKSRRKRS